jgi:UDP-galactopyranose mutase
MVMFRDQNAGGSQNNSTIMMNKVNSSFERVEEFKYLGTTLTNKNSIQEEIKSRLNSVNVCYRSVQNLVSSSLLSKHLKKRYTLASLTKGRGPCSPRRQRSYVHIVER